MPDTPTRPLRIRLTETELLVQLPALAYCETRETTPPKATKEQA